MTDPEYALKKMRIERDEWERSWRQVTDLLKGAEQRIAALEEELNLAYDSLAYAEDNMQEMEVELDTVYALLDDTSPSRQAGGRTD